MYIHTESDILDVCAAYPLHLMTNINIKWILNVIPDNSGHGAARAFCYHDSESQAITPSLRHEQEGKYMFKTKQVL